MAIKFDYIHLEKLQKFIHLQEECKNNSRFYCEACKEILIQPHQTECGVRYCLKCINDSIYKHENLCPGCNKEISSVKDSIIQDKAIEKEIFNLNVKCIHKNCNSHVVLKNLTEHLKICKFREINCQDCNELILFSEIELHSQIICKNKLLKCDDCEVIMTREKLETVHRNLKCNNLNELCENISSKCIYGCTNEDFKYIKSHLLECPSRPIDCLLKTIGCNEKCDKNNFKKDEFDHLSFLVHSLRNIKSENAELKSNFLKIRNEYLSEIENFKKLTLTMSKEMSTISKLLFAEKTNYELLKSELEEIKRSNNSIKQFNPIHNKSDYIINSDDGSITWVINDIRDKIEKAKNDIDLQIVSDTFHSHVGYKMKLKIYPNGDGIWKNKYLSAYFVIVKSKLDENLSWPFSQKVSLCVIKNGSEVKSTKVVMKPDRNLACYDRPTSDSNVGAGQPNFIKLQEILKSGKYICDGKLMIKFNCNL